MVRETKTLGQGHAPDTKPQDMPTVKNIAIYDSTRQVENWELAYVSEKIEEEEDSSKHLMTHQMERMVGHMDYKDLKEKYSKISPSEVNYRALLLWKKNQPNGLAQMKALAELLKFARLSKIVEAFEP